MAAKSDGKTYTKPELRDKIKDQVLKSNKGGNPGQWSARKAQLVAQEYEKEGGGYKKPRNESQQSLKKWEGEKWTTTDGSKARQGGTTKRYLPEEAWKQLSPAQKKATDRKKVEGSKEGKQFVANTSAAARARKKATGSSPATKKGAAKKAAAQKGAPQKAVSKQAAPKQAAPKKAAKKAAAKRATKKSAAR